MASSEGRCQERAAANRCPCRASWPRPDLHQLDHEQDNLGFVRWATDHRVRVLREWPCLHVIVLRGPPPTAHGDRRCFLRCHASNRDPRRACRSDRWGRREHRWGDCRCRRSCLASLAGPVTVLRATLPAWIQHHRYETVGGAPTVGEVGLPHGRAATAADREPHCASRLGWSGRWTQGWPAPTAIGSLAPTCAFRGRNDAAPLTGTVRGVAILPDHASGLWHDRGPAPRCRLVEERDSSPGRSTTFDPDPPGHHRSLSRRTASPR